MAPEIDGKIVGEVIRDKQTHGIFGVSTPKGVEETRASRLPVQTKEEAGEEKSELVIHDKELAKRIFKKLRSNG
jgi:hypothetical protein